MKKPDPNLICRHCRAESATRPRGLGWKCYYTPAVRDLYPISDHRGAVRSPIPAVSRSPLPPAPTTTVPGSPERIRVLEERAAAGLALFHPDDVRVPR